MIRSLLCLTASLLFASCGEKDTPAPDSQSRVVTPSAEIPATFVDDFSGDKALAHIETLTSYGPRPPESEGYQKSLAYLEKTLGALGWKTTRQNFTSVTPIGPLKFTNLLARFSPDAAPDWLDSVPFVIGSHLDTKRYLSITFLGANDSGSSTGVLVELARVLSQNPTAAAQVELVFFDGEEALLSNIDPKRDGLYGSRYYASLLTSRKRQPFAGIVLDLVGDHRVPLLIGIDSTKSLQAHAVDATKALKLNDGTVQMAPKSIIDDHIPLLTRGNLATLHLIGDFNNMKDAKGLRYWHTKNDTLEQLSARGLANAGKLTLRVLHQLTTP
ncbi:MAG: M28 family peptidase [Verrucomicrobiaceae bacterium]